MTVTCSSAQALRRITAGLMLAIFLAALGHPPEAAAAPFQAVFAIVALGAVVAFLVILAMEERPLAAAPG